MLRPGFPLNFFIKRHGFSCIQKLSPSVSQERYLSTQDGNDDEHSNEKKLQDKKNKINVADGTGSSSKALSVEEINSKNAAAKKKLLSLLSEIKIEQDSSKQQPRNFTLARAVKRPSKEERFKDILKEKKMTPEEKLQLAVKNVAASVSGDPEQTQLELNEKLQSLNMTSKPEDENHEAEGVKVEMIDEEMKMNIMSSVEDVATTVIDPKPSAPVKSELTQRLLRLSIDNKSSSHPKKSIDNLLKSMKIDRGIGKRSLERKERDPPETFQRRAMQRPKPQTAVNIFQYPPLDIFTIDEETKIGYKKTVWQMLEEKELKLLVQFAPKNGFEEMILWTEQGKHWKFPIDNEADIGAEENVGFNEHVFLEHHLHGFPTKGPIRLFMEHVIVGLSQNPYITADRKVENINWFRDYFKGKEEILREYGALG